MRPARAGAVLVPPAVFNCFQVAWVTSDLERAMRQFEQDLGIARFAVSRDVAIDTAAGSARLHFALAFVGEQQIELIEPAGGADAVYRAALPAEGFALRLHHLGHLVTAEREWQRLLGAIRRRGWSTPVAGEFGGLMHYVYADLRERYGHYLEFMYQTEAGRGMFADVPRHPPR